MKQEELSSNNNVNVSVKFVGFNENNIPNNCIGRMVLSLINYYLQQGILGFYFLRTSSHFPIQSYREDVRFA